MELDQPVCERGDDQPVCITQVLIRVLELGITDVDETVPQMLIPAVSELGQPCERLAIGHLGETRLAQKPEALNTTSVYPSTTKEHC